jgi:membrane-associated protease RseP (regulator of RpoE activity)
MRGIAAWPVLCGLLIGCEGFAPEPSPASAPARVVEAPKLAPPTLDPAVLAAAVRGGVRQRALDAGLYEVDAFLAALVVEDLRSARPSVTFTPVRDGEQQVGYSVAGVREGSPYGAVGLLDGDVVESINGVPLSGPDQVAGAIVGSERVAALMITRAGVSSIRELRIVPGLAWTSLVAARSGVVPPAVAGLPGLGDMSGGAAAVDPPVDAPVDAPVERAPAGAGRSSSKPAQPSGAARPTSGGGGGGAAPAGGGISCAGDTCTIARREFDAAVADPDRLTRQVSLSEAAGGYRLSGIRAGSQVSQLGFRNGDIIKSVNGTSMDDQFGLLALYGGLGSTSSYTVGFTRGGAYQSKKIRVR